MLYIVVIIFIVLIIGKLYNQSSAFYEVLDKYGDCKSVGNYNQCKSWIEAQKGMDNLSGIQNSYKIKKKKF